MSVHAATLDHESLACRRCASGIPAGRLALWWVVTSEIVIFGGLLASYLLFRLRHVSWGEEAAHTNTLAGATNTLVLLTSSLFAVLAHRCATQGDGRGASRFLRFTIALGGVFLIVKALEYTGEIHHGYTLLRGTFWSFYYVATGLHALHVVAGMIAMAVVSVGAGRGRQLQRVELVGIYWHFVDVVWIFLFPLFYIAK